MNSRSGDFKAVPRLRQPAAEIDPVDRPLKKNNRNADQYYGEIGARAEHHPDPLHRPVGQRQPLAQEPADRRAWLRRGGNDLVHQMVQKVEDEDEQQGVDDLENDEMTERHIAEQERQRRNSQ